MERAKATLETIREKYYYSDTQCRYWEMKKPKLQRKSKLKLISSVLYVCIILILLVNYLFLMTEYLLFDVDDASDNRNLLIFWGVILFILISLIAKFGLSYPRAVKKLVHCEHAIMIWNIINNKCKEFFERAEQGGIVYQDEIHRLEEYEIEISMQMMTLPTEDKILEQAKAETQKFFNLSTNPS